MNFRVFEFGSGTRGDNLGRDVLRRKMISDRMTPARIANSIEKKTVPIHPTTLIVGGGIAGIQAALDISDAGNEVYLVERQSTIGGMMAHALHKAGAEVSLVARGPHLKAIQENGLTFIKDGVSETISLKASDNPADLGEQDYVIITLKAQIGERFKSEQSQPRRVALATNDYMIGDFNYVAIPFNAPHKAAALVTANLILRPDRQALQVQPEYGFCCGWGIDVTRVTDPAHLAAGAEPALTRPARPLTAANRSVQSRFRSGSPGCHNRSGSRHSR